MSVNSTMTAIADKIRALLGISGKMGLDAMASRLADAKDTADNQGVLLDRALVLIAGKAAVGDGIPDGYIDTSDATAKNIDIVVGKTAYVDGEKVDGTNPYAKAETDMEVSDQSGLLDHALALIAGKAAGGGSGSSPYSKSETITWTPSSTVHTATINHSLGVVPDGYIAMMKEVNTTVSTSGSYNVYSYFFDVRSYDRGTYSAFSGLVSTSAYNSYHEPNLLLDDMCNSSTVKLIHYPYDIIWFPAGTTYEILVYKR